MSYIKRVTAAGLAVCMTASLSTGSLAAAPKVETDETAYILADYYGTVSDYSIVKGCDLNGNTAFADYGDYSDVVNMTTLDEPSIFDEGVSWNIENPDSGRFYYQVTPNDQSGSDLPWRIDVSYKLNGAPIKAEKLAGASGLVEITVKAIPNSAAKAAYKDNFILLCAMVNDVNDNISFSAPGSQLQTIGSMQAAVFAALPKQEEEFVFQIGTESFETIGVLTLMMPAKLYQLDDISEIKEHKSNLEDAGNAVDSAMADILDIMGSMRNGMTMTSQGLTRLDDAREAVNGNRDNISKNVGSLRKSLREMEKRLNDYGEFLGDADMANSISSIGDEIAGTMEDVESDVTALGITVQELGAAYADIAGNISQGQGPTEAQLQAFAKALEKAETVLGSVDISNYQRYVDKIESSVTEINSNLDSLKDNDSTVYRAAFSAITNEIKTIKTSLSTIVNGSLSSAETIQNSLGSMNIISDEMEDLLEETSWVVDDLSDLLKDTRNMLDAVDKTLSDSGDALNEGAKLSIDGMNMLLADLVAALQKNDDIQNNRQIISDIIRDEWHRFDDDMGVLDIDTGSRLVSFTSDKNSEPKSQQIIIRTQEISIEDEEETASSDVENENSTVTDRIKLVFKRIGGAVGVLLGKE